MATTLENANPTIFQQKKERDVLPEEQDEEVVDKIDEREVFDILYSAIASIFNLMVVICHFVQVLFAYSKLTCIFILNLVETVVQIFLISFLPGRRTTFFLSQPNNCLGTILSRFVPRAERVWELLVHSNRYKFCMSSWCRDMCPLHC